MPVLFICIRFNRCCTLLCASSRYDHISTTIRNQLHWLPVKQRIDHKLCTLIYKCLHNVAPVYLRDMCIPCHRYRVASASRQLFTATYGISPQEQKHLALVLLQCLDHPYEIHCLQLFAIHYYRDPLLTYGQFCSKLKSVMFNRAL